MNVFRRTLLLLSVAMAVSQFSHVQCYAQEKDEAATMQLRAEKIVSTLTKIILQDDDEQLRMEAIDALVSLYQGSSLESVQDRIVDALLELVEDIQNERKIRAKAIEGILVIMEELDGTQDVTAK